jgi:hypothetical protein
VLRAGGIDKFIYTPHNVFVCSSKLMGNKIELKPNWTSVVGHKIIYKKEFLREEFMEIYPVLETSLLKEGFTNKNQVSLKIRCFGWLLLIYVL